MRGFTLIEILLVVALGSVLVGWLAPAAGRYADRFSVLAAREATVALLAEARSRAMTSGSAQVVVHGDSAVALLESGGATLRRVDFGREWGVSLRIAGRASTVALPYDALGIGRMSSRTIGFDRGRESTTLVVSSYGRARRR